MYFKLRKYGKHEILYWNGKRWASKPLDPADDTWQIFDFSWDSTRIQIDTVEEGVLFVDQKPIRCSIVILSEGTKFLSPHTIKNVWDRWEKHLKGEPEEGKD